jgi:F0F1-type ATP synthase assembly protein I
MSEEGRTQGQSGTVWSDMGRYAHFGFQLALSMGLFLLGGWWLDGELGTTPLFTIAGAMLGAAAGFYSMIRQLIGRPERSDRPGSGDQEKEP